MKQFFGMSRQGDLSQALSGLSSPRFIMLMSNEKQFEAHVKEGGGDWCGSRRVHGGRQCSGQCAGAGLFHAGAGYPAPGRGYEEGGRQRPGCNLPGLLQRQRRLCADHHQCRAAQKEHLPCGRHRRPGEGFGQWAGLSGRCGLWTGTQSQWTGKGL